MDDYGDEVSYHFINSKIATIFGNFKSNHYFSINRRNLWTLMVIQSSPTCPHLTRWERLEELSSRLSMIWEKLIIHQEFTWISWETELPLSMLNIFLPTAKMMKKPKKSAMLIKLELKSIHWLVLLFLKRMKIINQHYMINLWMLMVFFLSLSMNVKFYLMPKTLISVSVSLSTKSKLRL